MQKTRIHHSSRAAFSYLELQIALILLGIALTGLFPLVIMSSRQTKSVEQRLGSQTVYYLAPASDLWSRKLGASAMLHTDEPTPMVEFSDVHVNFQQRTNVPAPGEIAGRFYIEDIGQTFGVRSNGYRYGWDVDITATSRDRDHRRSPDDRYDTLLHMQKFGDAFWEIELPEGSYTVLIVAGDPLYIDSNYRIEVEGVLAVNGIPKQGKPWIEGTISVVVTDGRLTIRNAKGSVNNKICFIHITNTNLPNHVVLQSVEKSPNSEEVTAHVSIQ